MDNPSASCYKSHHSLINMFNWSGIPVETDLDGSQHQRCKICGGSLLVGWVSDAVHTPQYYEDYMFRKLKEYSERDKPS